MALHHVTPERRARRRGQLQIYRRSRREQGKGSAGHCLGRQIRMKAAGTVARTSLSLLTPGSTVNLELPTPAGAPLGGHVVQGHVDAAGTLLSLEPVDAHAEPGIADWWLRVAVPAQISRYMV